MSESLSESHCEPCEGGVSPFTEQEIQEYLQRVNGWEQVDDEAPPKIHKEYSCGDFVDSVEFVHKITEVAEAEGHHPVLKIHYNTVTVTLWTHAVNGLTENDFILAAKLDKLST